MEIIPELLTQFLLLLPPLSPTQKNRTHLYYSMADRQADQNDTGNTGGSESGSDSQTTGIYINLVIGAITVVVCIIAFAILRRLLPSVYEARQYFHSRGDPRDYYDNRMYAPPPVPSGILRWVPEALKYDLDDMIQTHGFDYALYIRFIRAMLLLFLVLFIPTVILIPVYATASNSGNTGSARTVGIQQWSLSNLDTEKATDSWRFWVTLVVDYIVTALVLFLLYREFDIYIRYRIRYRASKNPANYTILVTEIPNEDSSTSAVKRFWEHCFPSRIKRAYYVRDASDIETEKQKFWLAVRARERAEHACGDTDGERPTHKPSSLSFVKPGAEKVDSIDYWRRKQREYRHVVETYQNEQRREHTDHTNCAFVTFKSRFDASLASRAIFGERESEFRVHRAPEPDAVNWGALPVSSYQSMIRRAITIVSISALTLFWFIPISFIMGLTSLSALSSLEIGGSTPFSFLSAVQSWNPFFVGLIESFLPSLILSLFLKLVPKFIRMLVMVSRVLSLAVVDRRARDWYFNFVVFSNFVFVLTAGSVFLKLTEIVQSPTEIASFLASSAPSQGAFITNFIILKALTDAPKEIIQIGRLIKRWLKLMGAKTDREKENAELCNLEFDDFEHYPMAQLVALLGIIYSTISPYIIPACILFFASTYVVMKYNLIYTKWNDYSSGGSFYGGALYGVWTGLLLHSLTMVGLYGLNKQPAQSVLTAIPLVVMLGFLIYFLQTVPAIAEHGSTLAVLKQIEDEGGVDVIPDDVAELYIHPGMDPLPDAVEDKSGVDPQFIRRTRKADDVDEELGYPKARKSSGRNSDYYSKDKSRRKS